MTTRKPGHPAAHVPEPLRRDVFDPALKHYPNAFVHGPPRSAEHARALLDARAPLLARSLHALARPGLRDRLVLRGSVTLAAWFPERARRAKDIDLIVRDPDCKPTSGAGGDLLAEILDAVGTELFDAGAPVIVDEIALDSIWTYERAEGRRISIPWRFDDAIRDVVQLDVVFDEPLADAPVLEAPAGGPPLWFASKAEQLAWKLLWLEDDYHPQGKDLYDAVLLAEQVELPVALLAQVFAAKQSQWRYGSSAAFVHDWEARRFEWETFALESPELASDDPAAWIRRLGSALRLV